MFSKHKFEILKKLKIAKIKIVCKYNLPVNLLRTSERQENMAYFLKLVVMIQYKLLHFFFYNSVSRKPILHF